MLLETRSCEAPSPTSDGHADYAAGPSPTRSLSRSLAQRTGNRYWWYRGTGITYEPPIFSILTDAEWNVMQEWYDDTDQRFENPGECSIPPMCLMLGLVMGSNIRRIVQLGHYVGFSTLLFGFMLRHMNCPRGLLSIDIDPYVTEYTAGFVKRAGLEDYVQLVVRDSAAPVNIAEAKDYLNGDPEFIFIDSSHQYEHTLAELDLWYPHLKPGGYIGMHDVSRFAEAFDPTKTGGVFRATAEWLLSTQVPNLMMNRENPGLAFEDNVYKDSCGFGLIHKPLPRVPHRRPGPDQN